MALIHCSECKNEISDKATTCPHCGCPLEQNEIGEQIIDGESNTATKTQIKLAAKTDAKKNRIIIGLSVFVCLALITGYFALFYIGGHEGSYAVKNAQELKDMLKDPNSLVLYDDVVVVYYRNGDAIDHTGVAYYTYIEYGAENSYGGMVRDIAIFEDYTYIGTFSEYDELHENYLNLDQDEEEKIMRLAKCKLPYLYYSIGDEENILSFQIINKDKIMRNL